MAVERVYFLEERYQRIAQVLRILETEFTESMGYRFFKLSAGSNRLSIRFLEKEGGITFWAYGGTELGTDLFMIYLEEDPDQLEAFAAKQWKLFLDRLSFTTIDVLPKKRLHEKERLRIKTELRKPAEEPDLPFGVEMPSKTELRILQLRWDDKSNAEIGEQLGHTEGTIKNYITKANAKLGYSNDTPGAIEFCLENNLFDGLPPVGRKRR